MPIEDITGLGKAIVKLIEVVSVGIGEWSKPYMIKRIAKAEAESLELLSEKIENNDNNLFIQYKDNNLTIQTKEVNNELSISERALSHLVHKEVRKQMNTEQIIDRTVFFLKNKKDVSEEKVDVDWINKFFKHTEDVSNPEFQLLWSKVLAGEIMKPGSFSPRTLDLLRNITKQEARVIQKYANIALTPVKEAHISYFYYSNYDNKKDYEFIRKYDINYDDMLVLKELNLIHEDGTHFDFTQLECLMYKYGNKVISVNFKEKKDFGVSVTTFTRIGRDLLKIIEPDELNKDYIDHIKQKTGANDIHIF